MRKQVINWVSSIISTRRVDFEFIEREQQAQRMDKIIRKMLDENPKMTDEMALKVYKTLFY